MNSTAKYFIIRCRAEDSRSKSKTGLSSSYGSRMPPPLQSEYRLWFSNGEVREQIYKNLCIVYWYWLCLSSSTVDLTFLLLLLHRIAAALAKHGRWFRYRQFWNFSIVCISEDHDFRLCWSSSVNPPIFCFSSKGCNCLTNPTSLFTPFQPPQILFTRTSLSPMLPKRCSRVQCFLSRACSIYCLVLL